MGATPDQAAAMMKPYTGDIEVYKASPSAKKGGVRCSRPGPEESTKGADVPAVPVRTAPGDKFYPAQPRRSPEECGRPQRGLAPPREAPPPSRHGRCKFRNKRRWAAALATMSAVA